MAGASAEGLDEYHHDITSRLEKARSEVGRLNRMLRGTNAFVSLSLPTQPELPPEVWGTIAFHTRGTRGPLRIGQVNRASREGVTKKAPRLWSRLERKHGIAQSKDSARNNVANYLAKRELMKRELLGFGKRSGPTRLKNKDLERVLRDIEGALHYQACATALVEGPYTHKISLPPWYAGVPAALAATCLCAAYAAICKPTALLVVLGRGENDTSPTKACLTDLLNEFLTNKEDLLEESESIILCNSSTIFVYRMCVHSTVIRTFDAIVGCGSTADEIPSWVRPVPERRVYFC